ncbi:MAG: phosphatase PAP2 family protein, partial [Desulfotomaculaceae bacterium]
VARVIRLEGIKDSFQSSPLGKLGSYLIWGIAAGSLLLLVFAKLVEDLLYQELGALDTVVGDFIRSFASGGVTNAAVTITQVGSAFVEISLMLFVGGYLLFRLKHTWEAVVLFSSLVGGWLLNTVLKHAFQRTRPDIQHLIEVGGYSFPSGHAMISTAFYGMLGYLLWLSLRERSKPAWPVIVLTLCLVSSIGASRVYLGVHFPSDVIAGFAAGGVWLIACIIGLHTIRKYKV